MANWIELFKTDILTKCGEKCSSLSKLASEVSSEIKEDVTIDSLFSAHRRHKSTLKLKPSLMDYMGEAPADAEPRKPKIKPEDITFKFSREQMREVRTAKKFIITSAMNNCPVDLAVWTSIQQWAKQNDAAIIVIPVRYKNPTSQQETTKQVDDAWWDNALVPYLTDHAVKLHEHMTVMAHVRIPATSRNPLSGLEALSKGSSAVFGHSQLSMKMVATPQKKLPKVMFTTGSTTQRRYSDSKAGVQGQFHHGQGAVIVELNGRRFHPRNVVADDDGGFYDPAGGVLRYYGPNAVTSGHRAEGLVTGDEHVMFNDSKCKAATYMDKDSIVNVTKPKKLVRHDVQDSYSISHHNRKDPVILYSKHKNGHQRLEDELQKVLAFIHETTPKDVENLIVSSNHHDHILQWIKEVDAFFREPWNADIQHEMRGLLMDTIEYKERGVVHGDPFALWCKPRLKVKAKFLGPDSEESICDVAVGMHGHNGTNGSRGTLNQFAKIGVKTVIGHSHTPGIKHGCYQVGTSSTLRMDYTKGPSSWAHCHCLIYPNGKRQLIFVVDGHWKG